MSGTGSSVFGGPFDYDAGGPGGWWIIDEPELHLGEEIVVPDLAGWRRERMPDYPDTAYFTLAPDWVCEVLSESTRKIDLHEKRPLYAREGVSCLWLVEPIDRSRPASTFPAARRTAVTSSTSRSWKISWASRKVTAETALPCRPRDTTSPSWGRRIIALRIGAFPGR